jgi:hypothetical protein
MNEPINFQMDSHILGVGIPMEFQVFKKVFQGPKLIGLNIFLNHWKALET